MSDFSNNELKLFDKFGYKHMADINCNPISIYRLCVEKAFCEDLHGPHVESLRLAYSSLQKSETYRLTPVFENLIKFE